MLSPAQAIASFLTCFVFFLLLFAAIFFLSFSLSTSTFFFFHNQTKKTNLPQAKAVDSVMKDINARFGKGSIMYLGGEPEKM